MDAVTKVIAKTVQADDQAGAFLIGMAVYDYLADQAEKLQEPLQRMFGAWALDRVGVAKRHLGRSYVEKAASGEYPDDSVQTTAQWLAGLEAYVVDASTAVSKDAYEGWARRVVYRDAGGRFSRDLSGSGQPSLKGRAKNDKKRLAPNIVMDGFDNLPVEDKARLSVHQGQWEQAGRLLNEMASSFSDDQLRRIEGVVTLRNPAGQVDEIAFPLSDMKRGRDLPEAVGREWDPSEEGLSVSIQARRGTNDPDLESRIAAFNALGTVGGSALQRLAEVEPGRWGALANEITGPQNRQAFQQDDRSKLSRFFDQLTAGGRVLSQISGQERLGDWAQFVGSVGPQAEQVMGPYVQRAAYRYRGTERTPDRNLMGALRSSPMRTGREEAYRAAGFEGDSLRMRVQADVAGAYLVNTLPKDSIYRRLSEKSGNVLPSQGILFDADGDVVSQAVGYADDHYLPFDLKGLARGRGGHYVRTRMSGGPTAEDIYAAVHMGARMVSVVSPSGVYTLEFDPAFRGARAGSDKARQMYDRYIKILDAVKGAGLYLQDIDPMKRADIERDVARAYPEGGDAYRDALDRRLNQAREETMKLDPNDKLALRNDALQSLGLPAAIMDSSGEVQMPRMSQENARAFEDILSDKLDERRSGMVNQLRLNGEGYAVALGTLQQQFPYFLKTPTYRSMSDFGNEMRVRAPRGTRERDGGYVGPGGVRAQSVRSGFYDYQGTAMKPKSRADATETPQTPNAPGAGGATPDAVTVTSQPAARASDSEVPAGGSWSMMRQRAPMFDRQRDKTVGELSLAVGAIPLQQRRGAQETFNMSLEEMAAGEPGLESDVLISRWFLSLPAADMRDALRSNSSAVSERLIPALQNREAVADAFSRVLTDTDGVGLSGEEFFDAGGKIGPATTMDEAVRWVADKATQVADLAYLKDPFAPMQPGDRVATYTGTRPQGFDDITAQSSMDGLSDLMDSSGIADDVRALLIDSATGSQRSLGQVAQLASGKVKALEDARAVQRNLAEGAQDPFGAAGVDEYDLAESLLLGDTYPEDVLPEMDIDAELLKTQRAWATVVAGKALMLMERGAGADPKAEAPPGSPFRKAAQPALTDPVEFLTSAGFSLASLPLTMLLESSASGRA